MTSYRNQHIIKTLSIYLITVFVLWSINANGQDGDDADNSLHRNNFQTWIGIKVNKDFKKGFSLSGQYMLRADVSNRIIKGHYFSAGVKYKILKYLFADFSFRGVNAYDKNLYRFEFGLKARYKKNDWAIAYRMAYFREHEYFSRTYQPGHEPDNYWRNRIEARYDFKKNWGLTGSVETYTLVTNRGLFLRRIAFVTGIEYTFKKDHTIFLYYRAQPDFSKKNLSAGHILAVTYAWDIPNKLFKKKKQK